MTELIIDQKIEQLKKITRQDGADKYAQALYELAEIYHYEKNDIEQAEYYYRLIEKNDNRQAFADAQLQLGQICQYYKKDIKQAEYYYRLVKKMINVKLMLRRNANWEIYINITKMILNKPNTIID